MNKDYWYIGQQVSDQRYGNGIIINIKSDNVYPIIVKFENFAYLISYTKEGKLSRDYDNYPSLSPYPHVPIKYNKVFKKGDVVKYKRGNAWYLGIYDRFIENKHLVSESFNDEKLENVLNSEYVEDENILKY